MPATKTKTKVQKVKKPVITALPVTRPIKRKIQGLHAEGGPFVAVYAGDVVISEDISRLKVPELESLARSSLQAATVVLDRLNSERQKLGLTVPHFSTLASSRHNPAMSPILGAQSALLKTQQVLNESYPQAVIMELPVTLEMLTLMRKHKKLDYAEAYVMAKKEKQKAEKAAKK